MGSHRSLPMAEPALRRAVQRLAHVRPARLHDRLSRRRGGQGDRRQPQPAVLHVFHAECDPHALAGGKGRLRRPAADQGSPSAGLCGDGPQPGPQCRAPAAGAEGQRAGQEHPGDLHQRQQRRRLHRPAEHQQTLSRVEGDLLRRRHPFALLHALARHDRAQFPLSLSGRPRRTSTPRPRPPAAPSCRPTGRSTASI